jgi:ADP-L-glycero-D-manno-heptose 6-epimerase
MILVTGSSGFIGSSLIQEMNSRGIDDIVACDTLDESDDLQNMGDLRYNSYVTLSRLLNWLDDEGARQIESVVHLGACSDTTQTDVAYLLRNNIEFSQSLWEFCAANGIPMIWASSASTYGGGEFGFSDDESKIDELNPLNDYADSKHIFDQWALSQSDGPSAWYGLKFFNVYGVREDYKGSQSSMVYQAIKQIRTTGKLKLFKSYRPEFGDGEQVRDFVYVGDVCSVVMNLLTANAQNGIYNVGTGQARTFNDLAASVFDALGLPRNIEYVAMPSSLRPKYQYETRAEVEKLEATGVFSDWTSIEDGVAACSKSM